jgi:hypothetical protein
VEDRRVIEYLNADNLPEGRSGEVEVKRIVVTESETRMGALRASIKGGWSAIKPGTYTGLYRNGSLWMSDTPDERRDHIGFVYRLNWCQGQSAIINGLGIGVVLNAILRIPTITHVDVVEIDSDVITLVEPFYQELARSQSKSLTVHHADAYLIRWPPKTRWTAAWHDIWKDICTDNLEGISRLHRRYGRRVDWQDSWKRDELKYRQRQERMYAW